MIIKTARRMLFLILSKIFSREIATSKKSAGIIKRSCLKLSYRTESMMMSMKKTKKKPKMKVIRKSMGIPFLKSEKIVMPNPKIIRKMIGSVNWILINVGK